MGWAEEVKAIRDAIISDLKAIQDLSNRVYAEYYIELTAFPSARVRFTRDDLSALTHQSVHTLAFEVEIVHRGGPSLADVDGLLDCVGEVVDKLASDRTLSGAAENMEIARIDLTHRETESYVFHYALLLLRVRKTF